MKPSKRTQHFHSQYSNLAGKPHANFKRLLSEKVKQRNNIQKITTTDKALLTFSYLISLQIGRTKKSDAIGDLLKPCMSAAAEEILDLEATYILHAIPTSNGSVQRRILNTAVDVEKQLLQKVKKLKVFCSIATRFYCFEQLPYSCMLC